MSKFKGIISNSLREWNLTNVRQIAILGWEMIKIRELFDYPMSDICRKRQTCLTFWRPFAKTVSNIIIKQIVLSQEHQNTKSVLHCHLVKNSHLHWGSLLTNLGVLHTSALAKIRCGIKTKKAILKAMMEFFVCVCQLVPVVGWPSSGQVLGWLHIEAETRWPPFPRQRFEMHFLEWKCRNFA